MSPADPIHRRTWDQIPWLVGGSADAATRAELEAHLADCSSCREEYEFQCRIRDGLLQGEPAAVAPDAALNALWQRLAHEDAAAASVAPVPAPVAGGQQPRGAPAAPVVPAVRPGEAANAPWWTRGLVAAVLVQAVALVMLAGSRLQNPAAPGYATLSSAPALAPQATLRLAPAPGLALGEWQALLQAQGLRVVEVSADGRFYGVASASAAGPAVAPEQLARLRALPQLLLVEPVAR